MGWEEDNLRAQNDRLKRERDEADARARRAKSQQDSGGCLIIILLIAFAMGWVRCGGC